LELINLSDVTSVQSVDRALTILDILKENSRGYGVTELSNRLDVSKSTIHRLLMSLLKKGWVRQDKETEKYLLGLKLIEFGQTVSENLDIRKLASPYLHHLAEITGETAHLVILDQHEIVYIDKIESTQTIRMFSQVGKRAPLHCTGVGKAILAFLPEEQVDTIIETKGLPKFTEKTITSREQLFRHLQEIKNRGYSIDDEEHELEIKCAAAPILNFKGDIVAGVSVAGPIMRISDEKLNYMAKEVLKVSKELSTLLGG
jgi:IclR family transcriptional regulator, KDG regulon repressor